MYILACNLPDGVAETIGAIYSVLIVAVPVIVILFGIIDLAKAAASAKEDEIKKNQGILIKRIIISVLVFLVLLAVKIGLSLIKTDNTSEAISCIEAIF